MAKIKITLVKSKIGSDKTQVGTIQALGLKKTNSSVRKKLLRRYWEWWQKSAIWFVWKK